MTFEEIIERFEEIKDGLLVTKTRNRFFGEHKSRHSGIGNTFSEITPWRPGEPFKGIRWRRAIQTNFRDILVVRRVEQKKIPTCIIANLAPSMLFAVSDDSNKGRLLIDCIGHVGLTSSYFHDPVSFIGYSDRIELDINPRLGAGHIYRIVADLFNRLELEQRYPEPKVEDINEALRFAETRLKGQHTLVLISDFVEVINNPNSLDWELLRQLSEKHTVIALVLTDPDELMWSGMGIAAVRKPQSGSISLIKVSAASRFRERIAREQRALVAQFEDVNAFATILAYGNHTDELADFFAQNK